jgi:hypothetical protein
VFYFGHLAGETGDPSPTAALVGTTDLTRTRAAATAATAATATLASHYDFNRDGRVNAIDLAIVRAEQKSVLPWLGTTISPAAPVFNDVPITDLGTRNLSTRRAALLLDDPQAPS